MSHYLRRTTSSLENAYAKAETSPEIQRQLSRVFFFSALCGGGFFFAVLAGPSRKMTVWKTLIFLYGVNPVMKTCAAAGVIYYVN